MKSHAFWKCWNQNAVLCRHELFIPTLQACVVAWVRGGQKQNGRFTHRSKQTNKQSNVPFTSLGGVCVRACGSERKVAVLVPIGPRWRFIQNDRQDPYAGVLSKRPARSLFGHTSHLTALRLRRVHVWMQVQHLLYTSERTSIHTITDVVVIYPTT